MTPLHFTFIAADFFLRFISILTDFASSFFGYFWFTLNWFRSLILINDGCVEWQAACDIQHVILNMRHTACDIQHVIYNMRHTTCDIQHLTSDIRLLTCRVATGIILPLMRLNKNSLLETKEIKRNQAKLTMFQAKPNQVKQNQTKANRCISKLLQFIYKSEIF